MGHHHDHHHGPTQFSELSWAFALGIGLNLIFTLLEFLFAYFYNSLALFSDATHNLGDVTSLLLAYVAFRLSLKLPTHLLTYGYKRASILASFFNSLLLVAISLGILYEVVERFQMSVHIEALQSVWIAGIGILINSFSAWLFFRLGSEDVNIRAAFLHLLADALLSLGVVVSALLIHYFGWLWVDPMISLLIAGIILFSSWGLLKESWYLLLDGVPRQIDYQEVKSTLKQIPGIADIHHIHIWAISSLENSLTAHVSLLEKDLAKWTALKEEIKHTLLHMGVQHCTLELESVSASCTDIHCT